MNIASKRIRFRIALVGFASLLLVWTTAVYELTRSQRAHLREAEVRTAVESQVFAEYSESTIKRLNELILDLRPYWTGDWRAFAEVIQRRQENIGDIAFQVAVIDRDGRLAFSNLARPNDRTDLSQREHFRVHAEDPQADRLFISKAIKGKVSGKWTIQFTRPIFHDGRFDGVLVVSVSPELFSSFAPKLQIAEGSVIALLRDSGEMMARYPVLESSYGQVLADRPYLQPGSPVSGNDRRVASIDGRERVYGYYKLPAHGLTFVIGEPIDLVLAPFHAYRNLVVGIAFFISLLSIFLFYGLIRALATQEALREELVVSKEAAEAANIAKSRFLATMSHEIRTPMNGILGVAQLLMQPELKTPERLDYAQIIIDSGKTLLALLNDILDLSKIESGHLELEQITVVPARIIDEVASLFTEQAGAKNLLLETAWQGPEKLAFPGDPVRLRQMLCNLVSNAIKFTAAGSIRVDGKFMATTGGKGILEFTVSDTGIGIPPDKLNLLFKPFSQVDASTTREFGGTGLGLSIVRTLAHLMGGEVAVNSSAGEGSCFSFRIPVSPLEESKAAPEPPRLSQAAPGVAAERSGFVLVVEDNRTNRRVIEAMLDKLGIKRRSVENGKEALDFLAAGVMPSLVLMDCQMPVMDGFAATTAIRHREIKQGAPRLPIIALTAGAFEEDRTHCMAVGMDDFLTKPINMEALSATLARWTGEQSVEV
jgi:signal transduction histidine kinase/CheY-like chemotaxis protein